MKKLLVLVLLCQFSIMAKFQMPVGAQIVGAGSTIVVDYMKELIKFYNRAYPCPKFVYKQKPTSFAGSRNGIDRIIDGTAIFAVSDTPLTTTTIDTAGGCLLQIPFILTSLSIIYRLPNDFGPGTTSPANGNWPGYLNISPADLCTIYTDTTGITWGGTGTTGLLNRHYNGNQTYNPTPNPAVKAYARSDSSVETGLFVKYLTCSNQPITTPLSSCETFLTATNVTANPGGPFCNTTPGKWSTTNVTCVQGEAALASAVASADGFGGRFNGAIGYVMTNVAADFRFIPGSSNGIPMGVSGLFITGSTAFTSPQQNAQDNRANYTQPTTSAVRAAEINCIGGELLCILDAYPIVLEELFVLYAIQPINLIACNIAQFIRFTLTQGQKLNLPGFVSLQNECTSQGIESLSQIEALICDPCVEPCNPCLNLTCPLPCNLPCTE